MTSEEVARHVGWRSLDTAEYYTQTKKVMNMSNTASVLASSTAVTPSGAVAPASSVAQVFRAKKRTARFFCRFSLDLFSVVDTLGLFVFSEFWG